MMVLPPVAAAQAGQASGGGLLDSFRNATGGAGAAPPPASADGSVGLFDGVLKKAAFGGVAGAAMGFIPFIPGGPLLGGIVGALGGAALGMFTNWRKMQAIKAENEAILAAMGVQTNDPQVKQILQSGNVSQLLPLMQQGAATQQAATQTGPVQQVTEQQQAAAIAQGQLPTAVDPSTAPAQSPMPTQGSIAVGSGGVSGAISPSAAVNPGIAPANLYASGGGGAAGDAGRPPAPAGANGSNVAATAPTQAGATAASPAVGPTSRLHRAQIAALIEQLQRQVEELQTYLASDDREERLEQRTAAR